MLQTDKRFHEAVERAVTRIEKSTDAEIVVVAAATSGSYRDLAVVAASVVALLTLVLLVAIPYGINPWWMVLDLIVIWLLAAWVASGRVFTRWMSSGARRALQTRHAAQAEFHQELVHATPHRTGVLIYISAMEGIVEVIPDLGLEGRIPGPVWTKSTAGLHHADFDSFMAGLDTLGETLAEHVPALDIDLVDLPNAPRVRS